VYRKVAATRTESDLDAALDEIADRYGPPTDSVLNLAEYGRIRIMADRLGVETIDREGRLVVIRFRSQAKVDPVRLVKVVHDWPGATLVPPASLKVDLEAPSGGPEGPPLRSAHDGHRGRRGRLSGRPKETSWWTARATAGVVASGFTKEEILRKPKQDPRAQGGMFDRLEELLGALS